MRTVNIDELTRKLNSFRMENLTKSFLPSELRECLHGLGFSKSLIPRIMKTFPCEQAGEMTLYKAPKKPIHRDKVNTLYDETRRKALDNNGDSNKNKMLNEESALAFLQAKGYQIRRLVGFDTERFQKDNPVLYKKYLRYEPV